MEESDIYGREAHPPASGATPEAGAGTRPAVDVIIPVYRGLEQTRRCFESVLEAKQPTPFELVAVNDASPEPELSAYLEEQQAAGNITLLTNKTNAGFVDSANLGMMLHPDRDVVLLNSDTQVFGDWLDRLRRCALSVAGAGTVTPFSNNATIASYPRFLQDNPVPPGWSAADLDRIFREVNESRRLEIPTAIGFCMYITRQCLQVTGYFDSLHFGRGYGEENDFSMRAQVAGFRHMLAGDVFVFHEGGASFGETAPQESDAAQETLRRRHPQYEPQIHSFFAADPGRELRRRADIARLARSPRPRLLLVTHRLGGGTEKFVRHLAQILEPDYEVLVMRPVDAGRVGVEWAREGEEFSAYFDLPGNENDLPRFLRGLDVKRVHYHQTVELPEQALELPGALGIPYDITVHDYYLICPLYNLMGKNGAYCGEPDAEGCRACLSEHEALKGLEIDEWRDRREGFLNGADRVIAPSRDAMERFRRYFPNARYHYLPHPEDEESQEAQAEQGSFPEVKVLVLGELSVAKGVRLLEACADDARKRGLPLCFRVLGWARDSVRTEPEIPLFFLGPYQDRQLAQLIERERADVIFFPALWPETYSYTLSAAIRSGLPVFAPRIGSFIERLEGHPGARLMELGTSPEAWNDLFMTLAGELPAPENVRAQ